MPELKRVTISGVMLRCAHCGGGAFTPRKWQLAAPLTSVITLGSLNETADVFVCAKCGRLHWFLFKDKSDPDCIMTEVDDDYDPECVGIEDGMRPGPVVIEVEEECPAADTRAQCAATEDPDMSELDEDYDVVCFQCGRVIPAGQSVCASCGWTYKE